MYVLECDDGSYYTGVTNDLAKRFKAHATGRGAKYTRMHPPRKVLLTIPALSKKEAQQVETWMKGHGRLDKERFVESGPHCVMEKFEGYRVTRDGEPPRAPFLPKPPRKKKRARKNPGPKTRRTT